MTTTTNRLVRALAVSAMMLSACAGLPATADAASSAAKQRALVDADGVGFGGAWHVPWCEEGATVGHCGGFTVYLVQTGDRICGSHYGSDERQNRMDEGEPRSISGVVVGSTAVMTIKSGRNHGVFLVRASRKGRSIAWETVDTVIEGNNGEPAFISERDLLKRDMSADAAADMKDVGLQCASPKK
jgi:hypothetical protein